MDIIAKTNVATFHTKTWCYQ